MRFVPFAFACLAACHSPPPSRTADHPKSAASPAPENQTGVQRTAGTWRAEHRLIDLHEHIDATPEHLARAVRIMDAVGIAIAVNLSGGTVTRAAKGISDFAEGKVLADSLHPGRFLQYMNLDYAGFDRPEFSAEAVKQVEEGSRLGASGFKEFKRLGLSLRDGQKKLITIDDPKLDAMWTRLGQLGMPVSIHVADPRAFWLPYDDKNERWTELKDHRSWWFGDPKANNAEDLEWVEASLDRHPNMMADLAARIPETGRHDPAKVRRLFEKHQDRILFATDFQV